MEFDSPLTLIGLIATVLSMTFALAAFLNSRRKHAQKAAKAAAADHDNAPPLPAVRHVIEQKLTGKPAAPREAPGAADKRSLFVFKQVGPQGTEISQSAKYADDEYIWE
jgi:hypothetical protein